MNEQQTPSPADPERRPEETAAKADGSTLSPLPGESGIPEVAQRHRPSYSAKGLLGLGLLALCVVAVSAYSLQRFATSGKKPDEGESVRLSDKPAAATAEPRKLEIPARPEAASSAALAVGVPAPAPRIPALVPTAQEADPIGVRRTAPGASAQGTVKAVSPEDAPVLLVSSRPGTSLAQGPAVHRPDPATAPTVDVRVAQEPGDALGATARNLEGYQRQLQGLLDTLTRTTAQATQEAIAEPGGHLIAGGPLGGLQATGAPTSGPTPPGRSLFAGQLQSAPTSKVAASMLGKRSLTLPKGTAFTCALKTKIISATSGLVGCQVQRNVYSDDGRVLLIERGSHMDGEYRVTSVRPGTVRVPVLWTRIRTPHGVTVDIESPGTGQLGESGIDGYVDNRWPERIGAALLLSLIDDSVQLAIQNQASDRQADTVVMTSTADNTSKLAEKVLDSTINIPPLIYQNQGGIVGIYVARDVDFSSVYELRPSSRGIPGDGNASQAHRGTP